MRTFLWPLVCLVALAGCDQNHHSESSKDADAVTVSGGNGSVTISGNGSHYAMKSSNGNETVEINSNGATPNLPPFVPLFPGAKVQSSVVGSGHNGDGGTIVIEAGAPLDAVISFYKQKSAAQGFAQTMNMQTGPTTMFTANSGKKTIEVIAQASGGGTHAQIIWSTN